MSKIKKPFLYLLIVLLPVLCAQKRVWQGQYITIQTNEFPKEDFKVGNYIVVAYTPQEYNKKSKVIYQFDIMENQKRTRMIVFQECFLLITERPEPNKMDKDKDYDYALIEINPAYFGKLKHLSVVSGTTHKLYEKMHSYEEIKEEVIDLILGRGLMPEY